MLTDSHCHLASERFGDDELPALVAAARDHGVGRIVSLSTDLADLQRNLSIAGRFPAVHVAAGIHPCDVHRVADDALAQVAGWLPDRRVVAVGETGLDYFHPAPAGWDEPRFRRRQLDFLERQFDLAAEHSLNVVLHTRDRDGDASFRDALAVYARYADRVRAVFHCFPGPWAAARRVIDLGGLVSFTGTVTFPGADAALDAAVRCPAGSLMVETDSPYLAPVPMRGRRNQPAFVRHVAERLAAARGEPLAGFARHSSAAAARFFRFAGSGEDS